MLEVRYFESRHAAFLGKPDNSKLIDLSGLGSHEAILRELCLRLKGKDSNYGCYSFMAATECIHDWLIENNHKRQSVSILVDTRKLAKRSERDSLKEELQVIFHLALGDYERDIDEPEPYEKINFYLLIIR